MLPETKKTWTKRLNEIGNTYNYNWHMNVECSWCPFDMKECVDVDVNHDGGEGCVLIVFVTANSKNVCHGNDGGSSTDTCALASSCSCLRDQRQRPVSSNVGFCLESIEAG